MKREYKLYSPNEKLIQIFFKKLYGKLDKQYTEEDFNNYLKKDYLVLIEPENNTINVSDNITFILDRRTNEKVYMSINSSEVEKKMLELHQNLEWQGEFIDYSNEFWRNTTEYQEKGENMIYPYTIEEVSKNYEYNLKDCSIHIDKDIIKISGVAHITLENYINVKDTEGYQQGGVLEESFEYTEFTLPNVFTTIVNKKRLDKDLEKIMKKSKRKF